MADRKTILIVEDDDDLRRLYRQDVALAGFEVEEARSGFEALRMLDTRSPDLVVLDLALPGVDGFAVRHELAAHAHTRHIPIVVVTASDADPATLDVPCILKKPVTTERLVQAIHTCLSSGAGPAGA